MSKIKNMEQEHSTGRMEENTTEPGKMENSTEEDSTTSLQDKRGQGSGQKVSESIGSNKHEVSLPD